MIPFTPVFRSAGSWAFTPNNVPSPATLSPGAPSGTVPGDLLILIAHSRSNTGGVSTPSGWDIINGFPKRSGTTSGGTIYAWTRIADGTSLDTPSPQWTGLTTGTSGDSSGAGIVCYRNGTEVLDGTVQVSDLSAQTTTSVIPAFTTSIPNTVVLGVAIKLLESSGQTSTVATFTERVDQSTTSGTGHVVEVSDKVQGTPGSSGSATVTWSATTSARALAVSFGLAAAVSPTLPQKIRKPSQRRRVSPILLAGMLVGALEGTASFSMPTFSMSSSGTVESPAAKAGSVVRVKRQPRPLRRSPKVSLGLTFGPAEIVNTDGTITASLPTFTVAASGQADTQAPKVAGVVRVARHRRPKAVSPKLSFGLVESVSVPSPTEGTVSFNLPVFTVSAAGGVTPTLHVKPSILRVTRHRRVKAIHQGQQLSSVPGTVVTSGAISASLPTFTFQAFNFSTGTIAFSLPTFTQVAAGGVVQPLAPSMLMVQRPRPPRRLHPIIKLRTPLLVPNLGTVSASLPTFVTAISGTVRGNDITAALPTFTFRSAGVGSSIYKPPIVHKRRVLATRRRHLQLLSSSIKQYQQTGTLAFTLPSIVFTASTDVVITGTVTGSIPVFSMVISGTVEVGGTVAASLPSFTFSAAGDVPISGTVTWTLAPLGFIASSAVDVTGTMAWSLPSFESAMIISETGNIQGQILCQLPVPTMNLTGTVFDIGGVPLGPGPAEGQIFPRG